MPLAAIMPDKRQNESMPWVISGINQNKARQPDILDCAFSEESNTAIDMSIDLSDNSQLDSSAEGALPENNHMGATPPPDSSTTEGVICQNNLTGMLQPDNPNIALSPLPDADVDMFIDGISDNPQVEASVLGKAKSKNSIGMATMLSLGYDRDKHQRLFNDYLYKSSSSDKKSHTLLEIQTKINIVNDFNQKGLQKSWLDSKDKRIVDDHIVLSAEDSNEQVKNTAQYLKLPFPLLMRSATTTKKNETTPRPLFVIATEQKFDIIEKEAVLLRGANNDKKSDKKSGQRKDPRLNMTTVHSQYMVSKLGIWNITLKECNVWYDLFKDITNFKLPCHRVATDVIKMVEWTVLILQYGKEDTRFDLHGKECDSLLLLLNNHNPEQIIAESIQFSTKRICTTLYRWWNQQSPQPGKIFFTSYYQKLTGEVNDIMVRMPLMHTGVPIGVIDETREPSLNLIISNVKQIFQDLNYAEFYPILTSEYILQDGVHLTKKSKTTNDRMFSIASPRELVHMPLCSVVSKIDGTISVKQAITKRCYAPVDFVFAHNPKKCTGVYHKFLDYKEVMANLVCHNCSDTTLGGVGICSSNVMIRGKQYYDYLLEESVWFETDWINSFGCLVQHRFHCTHTWFYPFGGS
jgi:hypothetical protein